MNPTSEPTFERVVLAGPERLWMTCPQLLVEIGLPVRRRGTSWSWTVITDVRAGRNTCTIHDWTDPSCPIADLQIDLLEPHVRDYIVRGLVRAIELDKTEPFVAITAGRFWKSWDRSDRTWFLEAERSGPQNARMVSIAFCESELHRPARNSAHYVMIVPALATVDLMATHADERALGLIAWHALNMAQVAEQGPEVSP